MKRTTRTSELSVANTRLQALQHAAVRTEGKLGASHTLTRRAWAALAHDAETVYRHANALAGTPVEDTIEISAVAEALLAGWRNDSGSDQVEFVSDLIGWEAPPRGDAPRDGS
jgi:hypothetical protein